MSTGNDPSSSFYSGELEGGGGEANENDGCGGRGDHDHGGQEGRGGRGGYIHWDRIACHNYGVLGTIRRYYTCPGGGKHEAENAINEEAFPVIGNQALRRPP